MATALMGLALVLAATGCKSNDESVIRNGVTDQFNQLKDSGSPTWSNVSRSLSSDAVTIWLDDYRFEIGAITVDGDTASVTVTVTNKQLYPTLASAQERLLSEEASSLTDAEFEQRAGDLILDELERAQPVTTEVVLACEKSDNTWSATGASMGEFMNALLGTRQSS
jgi:hypothetical protein